MYCTGIALLWLNLGARMGMDVQSHAPDDSPPEKCPGIYCTRGCVGSRAGLNRSGEGKTSSLHSC